MDKLQVLSLLKNYSSLVLTIIIIIYLFEIALTMFLREAIFNLGIIFYKRSIDFNLKKTFDINKIYETKLYKFTFVNPRKCIFTRKYDAFEMHRYYFPIKGIVNVENHSLKISIKLPIFILLLPLYLIFAYFFVFYNDRGFGPSVFFIFIIFCFLLYYLIKGYQKTKLYANDGINEIITIFNLKNM